MKTTVLFFIVLITATNFAQAQTLFTYGTHAVSKDEFLQAYNKNPDTTGDKKEKLKQYLDLYVNFRLKLQAAYDEKANTNADLKTEAENFKAQITENFINQQADVNQLMHEAFFRSQKDILVQQVFVQSLAGSDTGAAYAQIFNAYNELKEGKNFEDISVKYSNVPEIKQVKGDIGYITVFTLPYSIENIIYNLKQGEFSAIYKSKAGYHIFKNAGERPAAGRRKIEQLLFSTPSFYTQEQADSVGHIADSVYSLLQAGTSFASLAPLYGHNTYDYQPANTIEVKVGDYNTDFENEVFKLDMKDPISKPFKTEYGYNIIKLDEILPVSKDENDVSFAAYLQTQIQNDGRLDAAKNNLTEKWLGITGFKQAKYNEPDLWAYTDSAIIDPNKLPALYKGIKPETVLFEFAKKKITVKDWINYLQTLNANNEQAQQDYTQQMHDYIRLACNNYYREHIEDFDTAASEQMKEFNEANLLFYVMDKHIWSKASNDTAGLKKYYEAHKASYTWQQSVTALVFSVPDKNLADSLAVQIKNNPSAWQSITAPYGNNVYSDSSRFDIDQLPVKQKVLMQKDFQTTPESNEGGESYTFVHVVQVYLQSQQKTFEEAKGIIINDYQQTLEQDWLESLKKTYPVKINDEVFNMLH